MALEPEAEKGQSKFELFAQGNMVHVTKRPNLLELLSEGLLSPIAQAGKEGRVIPEATWFHPRENLYVKFLRFDSEDSELNLQELLDHYDIFGEFNRVNNPAGFVINGDFDERLWEGEPYVGIREYVHPSRLLAIVVPLIPMRRGDVEHLTSSRNRAVVLETAESIHKAWLQDTALASLKLYDHFGRRIPLL